MINQISILRGLIIIATMASIFTVLVLMILKILRRAAFFQGTTAAIISVSLSVLFLVGLSPFLIVPVTESGNAVNSSVGYFYILPGISLAVASTIVLSQVLLLASRKPTDDNPLPSNRETNIKESKSSAAKPKSKPGRPKKKEKPAEIKPKEATEPPGSSS